MNQEATDPIWAAIREEIALATQREPMLASFFHAVVLNHKTMEDALSFHLSSKLESVALPAVTVMPVCTRTFGLNLVTEQGGVLAEVTVYVDGVGSSPMIFADGFESGDTSAWSATSP